MSWRVADALVTLEQQVNAMWPDRDKSSDGDIGDANHTNRTSDHNPWVKDHRRRGGYVVTALDITNDPENGPTGRAIAEAIRRSRDSRVKYMISDGQICSSYQAHGYPAWTWRPYHGANGHYKHVHISVNSEPKFYDAADDWRLDGSRVPPKPKPEVPARPVDDYPELRRGSEGKKVAFLQRMLGIEDDGDFGPVTERAVKQFQRRCKLPETGVMDRTTWIELVT